MSGHVVHTYSSNFLETANQRNVIDFDRDRMYFGKISGIRHVLWDARSVSLNRMLDLKPIAANLINWIRNWRDGIISVQFKTEHSSSRYEDCWLPVNGIELMK